MPTLRDELCRFIRLNEQDQWVPAGVALEQLEFFGGDLIPSLVECLQDGHADVRHLAVQLLSAARPRSNVAVSALIERLTDEDWLIVTSTMFHLGDFGTLAASAIRLIEPWLENPNEYIRLLAATTITKLNPSRTEFVSSIREATMSDHPVVKDLALEFFGETVD
jgi:HEAT repeat protein